MIRLWLMIKVVRELNKLVKRASKRTTLRGNDWIYSKYGKFYIRVGSSYIKKGALIFAITLASVEIPEKYQRRGFFKAVLSAIETYAKLKGFGAVIVENVHNEHLSAYLLKREYSPKTFEPVTWVKVIS